MGSVRVRNYSIADEDEDGLSVEAGIDSLKPILEYDLESVGGCVGAFIDLGVNIIDGDDDHKAFLSLPCPNCDPGDSVPNELIQFLRHELDHYFLPDYWLLSLRDTLLERFVTPDATTRICQGSHRSAPYVLVWIDADRDYIARMPNFLDGDDSRRLDQDQDHQPAAEAAVQSLQPAVVEEGCIPPPCPICLDARPQPDFLRMPCTHVFHRGCLLTWLNRHHTCPNCRYQLSH